MHIKIIFERHILPLLILKAVSSNQLILTASLQTQKAGWFLKYVAEVGGAAGSIKHRLFARSLLSLLSLPRWDTVSACPPPAAMP